MSRAPRVFVALGVAFGLLSLAAGARAYDPITWRSIDGGGVAFASGGGYRLGATIGQPDAGSLAAGAFALRGGFWIGGRPAPTGVDDGRPLAVTFRVYPVRPNPVHAIGRVSFDLPRASRVALSAFDVSGRAVNRMDCGRLPAGRHERTWSAVDRAGRPLSSGIYFLRLDTEREQGVQKLLVVR